MIDIRFKPTDREIEDHAKRTGWDFLKARQDLIIRAHAIEAFKRENRMARHLCGDFEPARVDAIIEWRDAA